MKPWVIVDVSYLAYRAKYSIEKLDWEDYSTGVIFGLLEQLRTICRDERVNSNKLLLCFDSRKSYRKKAHPWYKAKRHKDLPEEELEQLKIMRQQIRLLRQELPKLGFSIAHQTGCESDDVMAMAAKDFIGSDLRAILVTADGDLYQCITEAVHWYDPARNAYYDPRAFLKKKGIASSRWGLVKAIAGCSGDGVPGIPGVGETTAIRYLTGSLPQHLARYKAITSVEGKWLADRNKELVLLPHRKTKPFTPVPPEYKVASFFGFCEQFGIMSYLREPRRSEWVAFLSGDRIHTRRPKHGKVQGQGFLF